MKKKEVLRRLSAISMAAMMTVTMIPSTAFAADEIFTDLETAVTEEDIQVTGDTEDISDADTEVEEETPVTDEEDISGEVETDTEESGASEDVSAFSDDEGSTEEDALFTAGDNTPAADATVHMTVSVEGSLATAKDGTLMADREVTVKDLDGNGILTYDEALAAAHDEYYNGGAAAGYGTATHEQYGLYLTKLWGDESGAFGYWVNDTSCNSLSDPVKADDYLTAFVYKDKTGYSDAYTKFEKKEYKTIAGQALEVKEYKASYNRHYNLIFDTSNKEKVLVYDSNFKPVSDEHYEIVTRYSTSSTETTYRYEITFKDISGTCYLVSSSGEDSVIVPAVAKVTVLEETPDFDNLQLYKSQDDYNSGKSVEITPAFDPARRDGYTAQAPDYLSSFYTVATLSKANIDVGNTMVMFSNNWGGATQGSYANGVATSSAVFSKKGYLEVYTWANRANVYRVDVQKYATLKNLVINGIMDKEFDRDVNEYHAYVDGTASGVDITATELQKGYTIKVNGTEVTSGTAYNLPYNWDAEGKMKVTVEVSTDGITPSVYTVNLEKSPINDAPFIITQPKEADYIIGETTKELSVVASANGELSYQWYSNTTDFNEGGVAIKDATTATYVPSSETVGTVYYYCVVTNTAKTENNTTVTETARITIDPDPTPVAVITAGGEELPEGYNWHKGYVYNVGGQAEELKVTATSAVEGGEFSYQWKRLNYGNPYNLSKSAGTIIKNATSDSYVPDTDISQANDRGCYYICKVTCTFKGNTYESWATTGETYTDTEKNATYDVNGVYVFTKVNDASVPEITTQPRDATYMVGDSIAALNVYAKTADGGKTSYQWYVNDKDSVEGGTAIEKGTRITLNLGKAEEVGVKYYYCVITNTIQGHTATATTNIAEIRVNDQDELLKGKLEGNGTQEDPYLIKTAEDYQTVADLVAQRASFLGKYLRQENDITLPEGWKPIGVTKDGSNNIQNGKNLLPFSGYLDGNNKTVTIPEGGLPLLGYVKEAEVHNLNIYGTKIAGYGLVNNFEGVGLSGSAIVIDNVTLKSGSSTLKAGLIGANMTTNPYAGNSAGFYATIRNCTVEKDVIVGYEKDQHMIGSIAGRMQGTVENCVSYATVYGKDYVGGIIGSRDNAMGACSVTNCNFAGNVVASDEQAGGIVGGGYEGSSAPNGIKISINACQVSGNVTGADKVGGIIGCDLYGAQAWNPYTMKGNSFTGKVQATTEGTKNIGGIIGFYDSLNKFDNIANNYYSKDCGAERGIGSVKYVDTNCATHETTVGEVYFNTENDTSDCPTVAGCSWRTAHNRTDDPLGADAAKLASTEEIKVYEESVTLSGEYKTDYFLGEDLDFTGMEIKVAMSDGTYKTVAPEDAKIEGYNKDKRGVQVIRVTCGAASAEFTVTVLKKDAGTIKVEFSLLGDSKHNSDKDEKVHTLRAGNLETWIAEGTYEVDGNATVREVFEKILTEKEYKWDNATGNYISAITKPNGTALAEKENGTNSGWMYTLNGIHSDLGVAEQYLEDGDVIVFHYTDDYTKEHDHIWSSAWSTDENAHWHECTYEFSTCDITDNAQKAGYGEHTFDEGKVTTEATCTEAGVKTYTCTVCGYEKTEEIPAAGHEFGSWKTVSAATVFAPKKQERTCGNCGEKETRNSGSKLKATIKLNVTSITLQKKQSTKAVKVTMANGDSVKSWTVGNKKIATVSKTGVIKAGTKTGTTKVTVTLKSGKKASLKVKVQKAKVKTTKISGLKSKATIKKGQKLALKPVLSPITSQDKISYTTFNKKVATVSKNGTVVAKKKGTAKITVKAGTKKYTIKITVK